MAEASLANWNLEWAPRQSARGQAISSLLLSRSPDIVCLTETYTGFLESDHVIEASADYGYARSEGRRKVVLYSKKPWSEVSRGEHLSWPSGRFIAGTTETPLGHLKIVGVCIPWRDAHVRTGRCDRLPWEEHFEFLKALGSYLSDQTAPVIVTGDFNQRIPRSRQPREVYEGLLNSFGPNFDIPTRGLTDSEGAHAIDHLAMSRQYRAGQIEVLPARSDEGLRLSDHFGFSTTIFHA